MARVDILPKRPAQIRVLLGPGGRTITEEPRQRTADPSTTTSASRRQLPAPRGPISERFGRTISPPGPAPVPPLREARDRPSTSLQLIEENERLRRENTQLRAELAALKPAAAPEDADPDASTVRFSLLELD